MRWKQRATKMYPDIILSDCSVAKIHLTKEDIIVEFSEYGFIMKNKSNQKYYRTNGAQLLIKGYDIDSISIKEVRTNQLSEELYYDTMYDIELDNFIENINTKMWKLEIVDEFYSVSCLFYIGRVRTDEKSFWCYIKIGFKDLVYMWNDLNYKYPIT